MMTYLSRINGNYAMPINPQQVQVIIEPYLRAAVRATKNNPGKQRALGLAMSREFERQMIMQCGAFDEC